MVMALVWNDAISFKRHLEHMRMFRQSHHSDLEGGLALLKDMPTQGDAHSLSKIGGAGGFIRIRGKSALVPMWEIVLPSNAQN